MRRLPEHEPVCVADSAPTVRHWVRLVAIKILPGPSPGDETMTPFVIALFCVFFCAIAATAAGFCHKTLKRMHDIEDKIYKRLDEEFEPAPLGTHEEIVAVSKQSYATLTTKE